MGITNKEAVTIIAKKIIIKNFLFSLIKILPLEKKKRKNIKIKEIPKPRYEPRVRVNVKLIPIAKMPIKSRFFLNLFRLTKKRETAIGSGTIKYSAK